MTTRMEFRSAMRFASAPQENYKGEREDRQNLLLDLSKRPEEDQVIIRRALERYDREGETSSYSSNPAELMKFIMSEKLFEDSKSIVDLGAGPGNLIESLATTYPDKAILGIDLSPSFTRNFNTNEEKPANVGMRMGLIDSPEIADRFGSFLDGSVVSVLTLDRVADPIQQIRNMGQFKGTKILAAWLPNTPYDDDPNRQGDQIVYTRPEKRIVSGESEEKDAEQLKGILQREWGTNIEIARVPIEGASSGGDTWSYDLWVFVAR